MSEQPTTLQPVNWEAVKMLALVVGVRESARRMGLNEDRVRQRCTREGWLADPAAREIARRSVQERSGMTCHQMSPTAALQAELVGLGQKTRLSLARGIAKAGEHIETMDGQEILIDAQNVKSVAQTADLIHGWKDSAPQVKIRLDVLNGSAEAQAIDVEASVSDSWAEDSSDPLDEY